MNQRRIRNIIFDFGGVIIDIDSRRTIDAFTALGASEFSSSYGKAAQSGIFDDLDRGTLSGEDFLATLQSWLPEGTTRQQVLDAWNRIIIGIPRKRIELLHALRPRYRTMLLSNTNIIHFEYYSSEIRRQSGTHGLEALFDETFLSFRLGMRKPEKRIFDHVFETTGTAREETLFIDDSRHIVEAARSYGIPSFWLEDGMDVCELFTEGMLRGGL